MDEENIVEKIEAVAEAAKKRGLFEKFWAIISYIGILSLVPLVLKIKGDYARFHFKQGVTLFVAEIIFTLIWIIPIAGWVIGFLGWIVCFIFSVLGIINVVLGRQWRLPVLGRFAEKIKI